MSQISFLSSSIGKKQAIAVTGLALILFLIGHLVGNLTFFLGPEALNAYAKKMASLRPGLLVAELGLLAIFITHVLLTIQVVMENKKARGRNSYAIDRPKGERSFATRIMPFTGLFLFCFVAQHLIDFTFTDHHSLSSHINGKDFGLYGLMFNTFKSPLHSWFYVAAMCAIGFHLAHGIQSVMQTFGYENEKMKCCSVKLGWLVAIGFSSIPLYVYFIL